MPWNNEARQLLDQELERLPYLPRISASRQLQMVIEQLARQQGRQEIDAELVSQGLAHSKQ